MKQPIRKRLRSRVGETITEVLVSVLIAALGMTLLAGMISAASKMITDSKKSTETYVNAENILATQPDSLEGTDVHVDIGNDTVTLSGDHINKLSNAGIEPVPVVTYTVTVKNSSVVSYKEAP